MAIRETDHDLARISFESKHLRTIFIDGPPGVGKTYGALHYGLNGRNVYSLTFTPETPAAEPRGFYMPKGDSFEWTDGLFIRAMREGARLVLNEISHASDDVLAMLYPVLEGEDTASLTLPTGETVVPAAGFQVIVTDNDGPEDLREALRDRMQAFIHLAEPHPDVLRSLDDFYRKACEANMRLDWHDPNYVSVRGWLACQKAERSGMERELAFALTFGRERGQMLWEAAVLAQS